MSSLLDLPAEAAAEPHMFFQSLNLLLPSLSWSCLLVAPGPLQPRSQLSELRPVSVMNPGLLKSDTSVHSMDRLIPKTHRSQSGRLRPPIFRGLRGYFARPFLASCYFPMGCFVSVPLSIDLHAHSSGSTGPHHRTVFQTTPRADSTTPEPSG